ncbi:MAG: HD-GYP domain-containing protein [Clostridia bacterium]|jgi:HD-GYP domain-containing protein (c-di-GMP phosphodiesterase class II)
MRNEFRIRLFDLILCLSNTMDLMDPAIVNHHKQVAYIAYHIGEALGLAPELRRELLMAGALHDIGAFSLKEKLKALSFELENPHKHAEAGYSLLRIFKPLESAAVPIRFHHTPWAEGKGNEFRGKSVPIASHILHLSDRIAVLIDKRRPILSQVDAIRSKIREKSGSMFMPLLVKTFEAISIKEVFWLDLVSQNLFELLSRITDIQSFTLGIDGLVSFGKIISKMIDFRNPFTATHSTSVAMIAEALAALSGFSQKECKLMRAAGYLHDLGKLAVPVEYLEKPDKLSSNEYNIMKAHTYYTFQTLQSIEGLETVNAWASFHHERLDGSGYPFHLKAEDIPLGSRIMAVADVFTALTEDRPYRKSLSDREAVRILNDMAEKHALDRIVVHTLERNLTKIHAFRAQAQESAATEYHSLTESDKE